MSEVKIIYSPKCAGYEFLGHPESPKRVIDTAKLLKTRPYKFIEPDCAKEEDVLLAHEKQLIERIKSGEFLDMDTPNSKEMFYYARLSAGCAIEAMKQARKGNVSFALTRPPGHHAGKNSFDGFCYFNNIAVAVEKAKESYKKIAIFDFDIHHGNGTQDIFLGDESVHYVSIHAWPYYPGTGLNSERNCINYPLSHIEKISRKYYMEKFEKASNEIKKLKPDLLAVSAGFDAYRKDRLSAAMLEKEDYFKMGRIISGLDVPTFSVLEGGYSDELPMLIDEYIRGSIK